MSTPDTESMICEAGGFVIDVDGTIQNDDIIQPYAQELIEKLNTLDIPYVIFTNRSKRTGREGAMYLNRLGLNLPPDKFLSGADFTALYIKKRLARQNVFVTGTSAVRELYEGMSTEDPDEAKIVTVRQFWNGSEWDPEHRPHVVAITESDTRNDDESTVKSPAISAILAHSAQLLAACRDMYTMGKTPNHYRAYLGGLVSNIEATTGATAETVAKPSAFCADTLVKELGSPKSVLVIGDNFATDSQLAIKHPVVEGAQNQRTQLFSCLVRTGVSGNNSTAEQWGKMAQQVSMTCDTLEDIVQALHKKTRKS